MPASPWPQPVSATVQPAQDNKPQCVPASPRPQPVTVTVQPSPDNKPQSVPARPRPQPVTERVQPPAPVQPRLPPAPAQALSVPDCTPLRSGSPSVEADLVLDDMDMDEEEWVPTAARTLDWLQAELAAVTEGLAWVHQQVSLSQPWFSALTGCVSFVVKGPEHTGTHQHEAGNGGQRRTEKHQLTHVLY
ncbi:hypothetical protein E2C01_092415 [Portunus trituberculatus]|uniref:Uncharacterized protein n=1 Tax=Portunus trituberculatus TaxID=210409 RepID=A0A5B7JRP1_PORTR|nr:hypothetical protein [Portunus trituberculatus]